MSHETSSPVGLKIVAAVITDAEKRVLLVRKQGSKFFMQPGGKPRPDEYPLDTLAREIKAELNCEIDRETAEFFGSYKDVAANEKDTLVEAQLYRISLIGTPSSSSEIAEMRWIDPEECRDIPLAPLTSNHFMSRVSLARA